MGSITTQKIEFYQNFKLSVLFLCANTRKCSKFMRVERENEDFLKYFCAENDEEPPLNNHYDSSLNL